MSVQTGVKSSASLGGLCLYSVILYGHTVPGEVPTVLMGEVGAAMAWRKHINEHCLL